MSRFSNINAVVFRCADCGKGVLDVDIIHIESRDDLVCPHCYDLWTDYEAALAAAWPPSSQEEQ